MYRAVLTEGGRQEMHDSGPPPSRPEEDPSLRSVILRVPPFNNYNTFLGLGRPVSGKRNLGAHDSRKTPVTFKIGLHFSTRVLLFLE